MQWMVVAFALSTTCVANMQNLQDEAAYRSGVLSADAFSIDQEHLYPLLGHSFFVDLSTCFYTRVYEDEQIWFRQIFSGRAKADAIQNQYEFFIQRFGGTASYIHAHRHTRFSCLIV